jgi:hypothetical protein
MLIHILCNFTKDKANKWKNIEYIRILGFNKKGQQYLNKIKKSTNVPIIANYSKGNSDMLKYEQIVTNTYYSILPEEEKNKKIKTEYQNKPKTRNS